MSSQKKIDANRRNGRKGRGPRSVSGKLRSRLNARKHGLSVPLMVDRELRGDVSKLARAIAGEDADNVFMEPALIIAETEFELQRIRRSRLAAITVAMNKTGKEDPQAGLQDAAEAYVSALPLLHGIERYERRAFSRRKKAVAHLDDLQLLSQSKS